MIKTFNFGMLYHWAHLIAMTEQRSENIFQEGQNMFIGFEEAPHCLQLYNFDIRTFSNYRQKFKE